MQTIAAQLTPMAARLRATSAHVNPVSQVELTLPRDGGSSFDQALRIALKWVAGRAGRPLPAHAWTGADFDLEEVGAQRTAAVSLEEPRYWTARLDDADRQTPQRNWVTEIAIAENEQEVRFGTRLHCVTRGEDRPYLPSVPRFVKQIVGDFPGLARLEGRPIASEPWLVVDDIGASELVRLLVSPERRLDVMVCALPEGSEAINDAVLDVQHLHNLTLGAAHVVALTGPASFDLSDRVGREFSVFRSGIRTYLPGFDPLEDEPYRHPLALPNRVLAWPGGGVEAFGSLLVANALRRSVAASDLNQRLPAFNDVRRMAAEMRRHEARKAAAPDVDLLSLAEQEIIELKEDMKRQRELDEGLVKTAEGEREQAVDEARAAEAASHALRVRIRSLEQRVQAAITDDQQTPVPDTLNNFEEWAAEHLSGSVELINRALRGIKKSEFEDPSLLYRALLLLRDFYVPMRREGGLERKSQFEAEAQALGLECSNTFSGTRAGEEGETYFVRHAGNRRLLDQHLKKGNSREPQYCFRCYFFWDETAETVVVGWLPSHLDSRVT